jgi:tetratricopeptide (TPR) repeat protein
LITAQRVTAARQASLVVAMLATGCAGAPTFETAALTATELTDVPFFPQTDYQCGPAALATILAYEGLPIDPEGLAPAVYIEGLQGSLQTELLGATRRHGFVPYPLEPEPSALFAELQSGKPVLVLQNLGLKRVPVWHYAVVIGFDRERGRVLLRSGTERRRGEPIGRFLRSWQRADQWAFVAVHPSQLPATATPERYVRALAGAAGVLEPAAADAAFATAVAHWPGESLVLFAAGGRHAAAGRWDDAAAVYEALLEVEPEHAAARNNLANVRAEQGCRREALRQARAALGSIELDSPLRAAVVDTVATLSAAGVDADEPGHCPVS